MCTEYMRHRTPGNDLCVCVCAKDLDFVLGKFKSFYQQIEELLTQYISTDVSFFFNVLRNELRTA